MEIDLDSSRLARLTANGRDIGDSSLRHGRLYFFSHEITQPRLLRESSQGRFDGMGQVIEVSAVTLGNVALFETDRSITGQDGHQFSEVSERSDPPAILANRLLSAIATANSVHVLSNTVTVRLTTDWTEDLLADATDIIAGLFVHYEDQSESLDELRERHYNSTISEIRAHNADLWVMKVKPDEPLEPYAAGQYTTLALGYWEPRADEA